MRNQLTHRKKRRCLAVLRRRLGGMSLLLLSACLPKESSFLAPAGLIASLQRQWMIEIGVVLIAVLVPIFIALPAIIWRYRISNRKARYAPDWEFYRPLEIFIWGGPMVIVAFLAVMIAGPQTRYSPERSPAAGETLEIQVIGMNWKWLFLYPDHHVATVNTITLPENTNIRFALTSDGTMQSFFIPALGGQIYAMGGMVTHLNLRTGASIDLLGENTQFNGEGFQDQKFIVHIVSREAFSRWVEHAFNTGPELTRGFYRVLHQQGTCRDAHEQLQQMTSSPMCEEAGGLVFRYMSGLIFKEVLRDTQRGNNAK